MFAMIGEIDDVEEKIANDGTQDLKITNHAISKRTKIHTWDE